MTNAMTQGFALPVPPEPGQLPGSLRSNPRLSQWIQISPAGQVIVTPGKVEIGQGILTALAQIAAEELDVDLTQITMRAANTSFSPNESVTSGSLSVQDSGQALRQACAEVRAIYLQKAAALLNEPPSALTISNGLISSPRGAHTSYWHLADDTWLDVAASGTAIPKPAKAYRKIGASAARLDLPDKIFGKARFIQDMELPGMLHGRMARPDSPAAKLLSVDNAQVLACDGVVSVVRDGSLLAVLATTEHQAETALAKLRANSVWSQPNEPLPDEADLPSWLRGEPAETTITASPPARAVAVAQTIKAQFSKPFIAHASIAPSCALAVFDGTVLKVWSHSQGIFNLRADLALAFAMAPETIIVQHVEGAGCYGHNPADDVAFDAAWLARQTPGRPVRVQWSRADELAWAPFGPAMAIDLEADLDASGNIAGWRHSIWSNGHTSRPGRGSSPALLGAWHQEAAVERKPAINPPIAGGGGAERNAIPGYEFPNWQVTSHRILNMPLRTSAVRSLGAIANVFAVETFIDDLARASATDPVEWRLRYLQDQRARAVIALALEKSGWPRKTLEGEGTGFAYARYKNTGAYCAVVAEIEAAEQIYARRLTIAVDVGLAINPDGVRNQIEGGAIQATSWALKEAVRFDRARITSSDWENYPILRFSEVPKISVHIIPSHNPPLGAGECSVGPTVAAIGNAVFDALNIRIRQLPITAGRIMSELAKQP